jgi:hypothetical protein
MRLRRVDRSTPKTRHASAIEKYLSSLLFRMERIPSLSASRGPKKVPRQYWRRAEEPGLLLKAAG